MNSHRNPKAEETLYRLEGQYAQAVQDKDCEAAKEMKESLKFVRQSFAQTILGCVGFISGRL